MDSEQKFTEEALFLDFDVSVFIHELEDNDLINDILLKLIGVKPNDDMSITMACLGRFFFVNYFIDDEDLLVFEGIEEIDVDEYLDLILEGLEHIK